MTNQESRRRYISLLLDIANPNHHHPNDRVVYDGLFPFDGRPWYLRLINTRGLIIMNRFLPIIFSVVLMLGTVLPAFAEELLWTEQAGQMICQQLSEGFKLDQDIELSSIKGMNRFRKQIEANENPELLVVGQMFRRCPVLTLKALVKSQTPPRGSVSSFSRLNLSTPSRVSG